MQLRLSELNLPLAHQPEDLPFLVARTLGIDRSAIAEVEVFKRSFDARKVELLTVYIADVTLADPGQAADLLARHADNSHIRPKPDMDYHLPVAAPTPVRPIVVGFGPCGIFAALLLAQMGLKPLVLERGAKACSTPSRTCSLAKAARARSATASCTARSRTRASWAAR